MPYPPKPDWSAWGRFVRHPKHVQRRRISRDRMPSRRQPQTTALFYTKRAKGSSRPSCSFCAVSSGDSPVGPPLPGISGAQCRKWRTPVKYIANPSWLAALVTTWSRTEPPGCTTAVTPACAAASTPSGKGKDASEANSAPAFEVDPCYPW